MEIVIEAEPRDSAGGNAARRLRREGMVPGVAYGIGEPRAIALSEKILRRHLQSEAFHSSLITLRIGGEDSPALLRAVQMHPYKPQALHVDFQLVREDREISAAVPLHFINHESAPGVKLRHGIFSVVETEVAVHCLARDLPEYVEVDVGHLDIGGGVHLADVPQIKGVRFDALTRGENPIIASVLAPKEEPAEQEAPAAVAAEEEAAAPADADKKGA
jgi:large subunit ribosomal protein L25